MNVETVMNAEQEASLILEAIRDLPVSQESKDAALNLFAAGEAWLGDEDAGTVAEALCKQSYQLVNG